jgi:hypothetical protein
MFCKKIYQCKNSDWCARDFNPKSDNPECFEQKTHFDEIKAMSVEELARWISHITGCPLNNFLEYSPIGKCVKKCKAKDCWIAWLKSQAEVDNG